MRNRCFLWGLVSIAMLVPGPGFLWGQSNFNLGPDLLKADYAVFRYDSSQVYWEIYYALNQSQLSYLKNDAGVLSSDVLLQLRIYGNDTLWTTNAWKSQNSVQDSLQLAQRVDLLDKVNLLAPPGNYAITLMATDLNSPSLVDSVKFTAIITPFLTDMVALSDLELSTSITRKNVNRTSPFYKNTLMVIPNPAKVYGEKNERVYFYVESYNLLRGVPGESYGVAYYIADLLGKPVELVSPVRQQRKKQHASRVEFGSLNVGVLPSGTYFLHFNLSDSTGNLLASKSKKFFVYKAESEADKPLTAKDINAQLLKSEFGTMNETELEQEFKYTGYILSTEQKASYEELTSVDAKRRFLFMMWRAYDPEPNTLLNEFRRDYMARIQYANENFSTLRREGWHTDRGRVYIIYGKPNYVESHPNEENTKPYEIWNFDQIQGGVLFIFGDLTGFRNYELIHSTARGEIQNPNYMQILRGGFGF